MERFGACLHDWMKAESISTAVLTKLLGYQSKTSVLRALRGENNYAAYERLYASLESRLDSQWQERFRKALSVERIGAQRAELFDALDRQLFGSPKVLPSESSLPHPAGTEAGELLILGFPHPGLLDMAGRWLALNEHRHIIHYVTKAELLRNPDLIPELIGLLPCLRYRAALFPERPESLTWNAALYLPESGSDAQGLFFGTESPVWRRLEGAKASVQSMANALSEQQAAMLFRFDRLCNGTDYLRFTEEAYRIERDKSAVIVKPTPGMQMLPAQTVAGTFTDYLAENTEPVAAMKDTLIRTLEKRVNNFYHRSKPTMLYLSVEAMKSFARTGLLSDQFFAFRPYTVQERITCLEALRDFAQQDEVRVCLRQGPAWPVSFEAYGGSGVLLYPSKTNYHSDDTDYRELFLPGKAFSDLFTQYAEEYLFHDAADDSASIARLIATAERAE